MRVAATRENSQARLVSRRRGFLSEETALPLIANLYSRLLLQPLAVRWSDDLPGAESLRSPGTFRLRGQGRGKPRILREPISDDNSIDPDFPCLTPTSLPKSDNLASITDCVT